MMDKPIRVLQIVTQMNRAGMESRLMDLYRNMDNKKIQFDFYTCRENEGTFDKEIINRGGRIFYNKPLSVERSLNIPNRFASFFKKHPEYNIVHCHLNQWSGLILAGAKKAGVPTRIAHSRTSLENKSIQNLIKNIIKKPVNLNTTHRFAVSKKAGNWLFGKNLMSAGKVNVLPNAIDCNKFRYNSFIRDKIRKELKIKKKFVIMHVGNLRPEKNHIFLLEIFSYVKKKKANAVLMLIGTDHMNGKIQRAAGEYNVEDDIYFLGSRADVHELLQAGDVFVFPSFYEGFPGALLEAQTAGLPCIISDTITDEVMLSPHITKIKLESGAQQWAEKVLSSRTINRKESADNIIEQGYDIEDSANKMTDFYLSL